ncbi:MAG TPA: SGNH/GDSL hydrolase family protein [Candidatus Lumbricidophila sp.]|nr:SGNH/GDSL hydrolase family protein [Candidatus Lumbricidophila sp.]
MHDSANPRPHRDSPARTTAPSLLAGIRQAATALGASIGLPRSKRRMRENHQRMAESIPAHSKWWRESVHDPAAPLHYVALGDSAAQGLGARHPSLSYVGQLAETIAVAIDAPVRVTNLSVSGATTELCIRDQLPRLRDLAPDVLTVAIGANDIARWEPAAFARNIRQIFDALPDHAIVAELPCFHLPRAERRVAEANRMLRAAAAARRFTLVPLHAATKGVGVRGILTQFANDMFHPNEHGYRVWAAAFAPAVVARARAVVASRG